MWETADLSTALRFGRDDKLGVIANLGFFNPFLSRWMGRTPRDTPVEMTKIGVIANPTFLTDFQPLIPNLQTAFSRSSSSENLPLSLWS